MSNLPQKLKTVNFDGLPVAFTENGYLNATMIAKHYGKRVQNYLKSERTQDYIRALDEHLSEAVFTASVENSEAPKRASQNDLVIVQKGNSQEFEQGTWLHPKLAIDFARWLNPRFAVWCDMQIEQMTTGSLQSLTAQITETSITLQHFDENLSKAGWYLATHGKQTKPQLKAKLTELLQKAQPYLPFIGFGGAK
ncbi:KilA-N domain-containing protein [Moraxella haemolytica]|uniref:KilA-N domain-containing protein n=1 Tax=Moraxella TaxID=475 RepID=UPI002543E777|nr:KilA-N domain-containing protein [Moraxella sp. ZY171148]WII94994.1 KilA-N domain-containing protein [Moraxella sp. ZY171148]